MNGIMWGLINIVGPLLLLAAIVYVFVRNRRRPRGEIEQAERGAREVREEIAEDEARDRRP